MSLDENVQIILGGLAVSDSNPIPVTNEVVGAIDDDAATDPADDGTLVALLKGLLTEIQTLNTNLGAIADAAVSTTETNGTAIALLKGLIVLNQPAG